MTAYLTPEQFRDETVMPAHKVDEIMLVSPNWLPRQLTKVSGWIDTRLRKRYAAPFVAPYPEAVIGWLTSIVTHLCYLRLGFDPNDAQAADVVAEATTAKAEVLEAADSEKGLFDLPLRADTTTTGIAKQGPQAYVEASPYVWANRQRSRARSDDERGGGSGV